MVVSMSGYLRSALTMLSVCIADLTTSTGKMTTQYAMPPRPPAVTTATAAKRAI